MQLEIEQKFPLEDFQEVQKALLDLGAKFEDSVQQIDRYFRHPQRDFAQTDEALRLRKVGEDNCITYKGPKIDRETKTRREIELAIEPGKKGFEAWSELLEILGFRQSLEVSKERTPGTVTWEGDEVQLALDVVAGLGRYLELEIVADESEFGAAKARLLGLAERLGLKEVERRGYLSMLLDNSAAR
jgi:adenylate cyclase, class 2